MEHYVERKNHFPKHKVSQEVFLLRKLQGQVQLSSLICEDINECPHTLLAGVQIDYIHLGRNSINTYKNNVYYFDQTIPHLRS